MLQLSWLLDTTFAATRMTWCINNSYGASCTYVANVRETIGMLYFCSFSYIWRTPHGVISSWNEHNQKWSRICSSFYRKIIRQLLYKKLSNSYLSKSLVHTHIINILLFVLFSVVPIYPLHFILIIVQVLHFCDLPALYNAHSSFFIDFLQISFSIFSLFYIPCLFLCFLTKAIPFDRHEPFLPKGRKNVRRHEMRQHALVLWSILMFKISTTFSSDPLPVKEFVLWGSCLQIFCFPACDAYDHEEMQAEQANTGTNVQRWGQNLVTQDTDVTNPPTVVGISCN